jgi:hypothetical protein
MAGSLERLYGTSTVTPGLPYIPIAKDASQTAINAQIAALQTAYLMFLAKNVVSGSVVPAAAPAANFQFQSLLTTVGHDTLRSVDHSSIGDISLGATFQVANTFSDTSAAAASRPHVRLAVNGTLRIGTGQPGNRNRFFDFGTGYGQPGLEGGVATDVQVNGRLSATAIGSYTLQLGSVDVDRVPNTGNLAYPLGPPIAGTFSAGNVLALSVIPRLRLAGYFALNGRYSILRIGADQYSLGPSSDPLTAVLPTAPYGAAAATAQQVADLLAWASRENLTVVPRGSGSKLDWGARPHRIEISETPHGCGPRAIAASDSSEIRFRKLNDIDRITLPAKEMHFGRI